MLSRISRIFRIQALLLGLVVAGTCLPQASSPDVFWADAIDGCRHGGDVGLGRGGDADACARGCAGDRGRARGGAHSAA